jgi:protein tyrosine phosphatase (PTP) superfamily phosphohydrolase (DUF442 family)
VQALGEELAAQPRFAVKGVLDTVVNVDSKTLPKAIEDEKLVSHAVTCCSLRENNRSELFERCPMKTIFAASLFCLLVGLLAAKTEAANSDEGKGLNLLNRIDYSPSLTTSGQPTGAELALIAAADYDRVIFLAFSNHPKAVAHEDDMVRGLGLQFIHIPVEWESPSLGDFAAFAAVMQAHGSGRTLVHCEVNFRASVFGFLYQVLYEGADLDEAMSLMQSIWVPNAVWEAFIARVMSAKGIDYPPL